MSKDLSFRRNIGVFGAVMIGIEAMMGPGIFALPGEVAHMVGPLAIVVYLAMGALTVFTALNYSELGAAIPLVRSVTSWSRSDPRTWTSPWPPTRTTAETSSPRSRRSGSGWAA